jgi:hypothetical protein
MKFGQQIKNALAASREAEEARKAAEAKAIADAAAMAAKKATEEAIAKAQMATASNPFAKPQNDIPAMAAVRPLPPQAAKAEVQNMKPLIKHGFFKRDIPVTKLAAQDFKQALSEEIGYQKVGIMRAFNELGIKDEPTPDVLVLAHAKFGKSLVDLLDKYAPVGGVVGQNVDTLAKKLDFETLAYEGGLLHLVGDETPADAPKPKWYQSFDWGAVLGGAGQVLGGITKPKTAAPAGQTPPPAGNNNDTPKEDIMGIPKTMFFGGIVVVVLGVILYLSSRK